MGQPNFNEVSNIMNKGYVYQHDIPQQQISDCNPKQGYYQTMREFKELPWRERADVSFQQIGQLWGYSWLVIIPLIIGAMFYKQILEWLKNNKISIVSRKA